ncbi:MAG: methyl-accepting chemotaxis protein, partial [Rhodoferax sp.]
MRYNQPVTQHEYILRDNQSPISRTDAKGRITFVNADFCEASGYSEDELMGKAHNLLRHPDMPEEAFADMWRDLPTGKTWTGLVKNRCKNGDFYWVLANVSPMWQNGQIMGYASVRMKPERETIAPVDAIYRRFREGKAKNLRIEHGRVVRASLPGQIDRLLNPDIRGRLARLMLLAVAIICVVGALGISSARTADEGLQIVLAMLAGTATMLVVGWRLQRSITAPINEAVAIAKQIAAGFLANKIDRAGSDEVGQLMNALYA